MEEGDAGEQMFKIDVETFIESILLELADKGQATLEDVQERIVTLLKTAFIPVPENHSSSSGDRNGAGKRVSSNKRSDDEDSDHSQQPSSNEEAGALHPLWKALDSPPGLRERIRRAARRLALGITHDSDAKQTNITTTDGGVLELTQGGGGKALRTVEDLSFAKGVIRIRKKK